MARPTARLDLYLVPPSLEDDAADQVRARHEAQGLDALPGVRPTAVRVDDPGKVVVYGNQVGGFQVRCGQCGGGVAGVLRPHGLTTCPSCGLAQPFEALRCRPPAARGRAALVLIDVDTARLDDPVGWRVVARRV